MHERDHFERVEKIGHYIADKNGADKKVITYFAYYHDVRRFHDGDDPEHGNRAAIYVKMLYEKGLLDLNEIQLSQLVYACANHSDTYAQSDDITIQTCWDSDRLDLWRINIEPNPKLLYSEVAKKVETIEYARKLQSQNVLVE